VNKKLLFILFSFFKSFSVITELQELPLGAEEIHMTIWSQYPFEPKIKVFKMEEKYAVLYYKAELLQLDSSFKIYQFQDQSDVQQILQMAIGIQASIIWYSRTRFV